MFYPNQATDSLPLKKLSWKPLKTLYLDTKEELKKISLERQTKRRTEKDKLRKTDPGIWDTVFKKGTSKKFVEDSL